MKPPSAAEEPLGNQPPGNLVLPATLRFTLGSFFAVLEGCTYRAERTTVLAKRVPAAPPGSQPAPARAESAVPGRFVLHHERACWVLYFQAGHAYLKPEVGLEYVAWLLAHPGQRLTALDLFSRFSARGGSNFSLAELPDPEGNELSPLTEGLAMDELSLDPEEERARAGYYGKLAEYKQTAADPALREAERLEARRLHDELSAFLKEHYRPAAGAGRAVSRLVHKSLRRLQAHLRRPAPDEAGLNSAAVAFAEYVEATILVPSRRYTRAKAGACVRLARAELAGRLVFECPAGDHWSVRF